MNTSLEIRREKLKQYIQNTEIRLVTQTFSLLRLTPLEHISVCGHLREQPFELIKEHEAEN